MVEQQRVDINTKSPSQVDVLTHIIPQKFEEYEPGRFRLQKEVLLVDEDGPVLAALTVRDGFPVHDADRITHICQVLGIDPTGETTVMDKDERAVKADLGLEWVFRNYEQEAQAEIRLVNRVVENIGTCLERLGIPPSQVKRIIVGSSIRPNDQNKDYAQLYAQEAGLSEAIPGNAHGACSSGMLVLLKAYAGMLTDPQMAAKMDMGDPEDILVWIAQEAIMRKMGLDYDPRQSDAGSARVFTGAEVVVAMKRKAITLRGPITYKEIPDTEGLLAARADYTVIPSDSEIDTGAGIGGNTYVANKGYAVTYEDAQDIYVGIPEINNDTYPDRDIDMRDRVGGLFQSGISKTIREARAKFTDEAWDEIESLVMHFPSKYIAQHAIAKLLKFGLMPKGILRRYFGRDDYTTDEVKALADHIKEIGFQDLPGDLPVYPQENPYGNAPAANAPIAFVENMQHIVNRDTLLLAFGAGASFLVVKVRVNGQAIP